MSNPIKDIQDKAKAYTSAFKAEELKQLDRKQKDLLETYRNEERVDVSIAPMYAAEFGKLLRTTVNCISVTVPCDGRHYKVPVTFATEINRKITLVNRRLEREKAAEKPIFEATPGAISLV